MPIPFKLDYAIEKLVNDGRSEQRKIRKLAGVKIEAEEAHDVWTRILEHKWYISERLGRDTGLRVAAIDYFENIHRKTSKVGSRQTSLPPRLRFMQPLTMAA
ncbi:MAG TPA: DUF4032 domain-containing protein [Pyrinomonadaceae bacterium]|nr:DUF4032 domain-containing protein [Pyrinomonadaceae bacterium]